MSRYRYITILLSAIFYCSVLSVNICKAQAPALLWQKSYGGTDWDENNSIVKTTTGFILAGYTHSTDDDVAYNHGLGDAWIVKLDDTGKIVWEKTYGGSDDDDAFCIAKTKDGGYITAGITNSNDGDVTGWHFNTGYLTDVWIVKINDTGKLMWQKTYGGSGNEDALSIEQTSDGGYIAVGAAGSTDGDVTGFHGGFSDMWVIRLDDTGGLKWQKTFGGTDNDQGYAIHQTMDGNFIVAGNYANDGWILKLDTTGKVLWQKTIGGSGDDYIYDIKQTTDSGYAFIGYTSSTDGNCIGNHGGLDVMAGKLNADGSVSWVKVLGGTYDEYGYSIRQTTDSGYTLSAATNSDDGDVAGFHGTAGDGNFDYWVVKLKPNGDLDWQKTLGGTHDDDARGGIVQTSDTEYVVAGVTRSDDGDVTKYRDTGTSLVFGDWWVVKLSNDTPKPVTTVPIINNNEIAVYPTITNGIVHIRLPRGGENAQISLINMMGQKMDISTDTKQLNRVIHLTDLPFGLYVVQININGQVVSRKIVYR